MRLHVSDSEERGYLHGWVYILLMSSCLFVLPLDAVPEYDDVEKRAEDRVVSIYESVNGDSEEGGCGGVYIITDELMSAFCIALRCAFRHCNWPRR